MSVSGLLCAMMNDCVAINGETAVISTLTDAEQYFSLNFFPSLSQ